MHRLCVPLMLLLLGCPDPVSDPGFGRGDDDDTIEGDDDDTTASPDDDDTVEPLEIGGSVNLGCYSFPDDDFEAVTRCRFDARFRALLEEGTPSTGGVAMDSPEATDTCAITRWDEADTVTEGGTSARYDDRSAGLLTLAASDWSVDLTPEDDGAGSVSYSLELGGDAPPRFDATYAVEAGGAEFPGFSAPDAIHVPQALLLGAPDPSAPFEVSGDALPVEWSGGSEATLWLELHNETSLTSDNAQITCLVANDGAFTIPAELIAQLPPDSLRLVLGQPVSGWFDVGGLRVDVGATATVETRGEAR